MPLAARILVLSLALMAATCGQKGPLTPPANLDSAAASQTAEILKTGMAEAQTEAVRSA